MKCENPMLAVKVGDKYRFVGAIKDSDNLRNRKYLHDYDGNYIVVRCGQCFACRLERAQEWAVRCVLEAKMSEENCFITLTYDDEHLPEDYGLVKKDFQDFMKRLRKNTGEKIRFYMSGEYGELYGRPHYHACLFGYRPKDLVLWSVRNGVPLYSSETLSRAWKYQGYVTVGDVTYDSACYVARYINKKLTGEQADLVYHGRQPPYTNMSLKPGIAKPFLDKYGDDIYGKDFIVIRDGLKIKPPRYFDTIYDRMFSDDYYRRLDCQDLPSQRFNNYIVPNRLEQSESEFCRNPDDFSFEAITRKGRWQRVKRRNDRRDYVEE